MIDADDYKEFVDVVAKAKKDDITCILIFKPDVNADAGEPESPDMIVCTSNEPNVIAALLGNFPINVP